MHTYAEYIVSENCYIIILFTWQIDTFKKNKFCYGDKIFNKKHVKLTKINCVHYAIFGQNLIHYSTVKIVHDFDHETKKFINFL